MPLRRRQALASAFTLLPAWQAHAQRLPTPPDTSEEVLLVPLKVGPATIALQFAPGFNATQRELARKWVLRSANAVTAYFGRYPVNGGDIVVVPTSGSGVNGGTTFNGPPPTVRVNLGLDTSPARLLDDWVMVHEMVHLAIPYLPQRHSWFHEGAATYVEIIARARAGLTTASSVWVQLPANLHQGLPLPGDRGLDFTPSWGRTYWGGAMFCLLADVDMRKRSGNRVGLQDALRGLVATGTNYGIALSLEETLRRADRATGMTVLAGLYADMKDKPVTPDLPQLWKDLGVEIVGRSVSLRDDAPLSAVRNAITASA